MMTMKHFQLIGNEANFDKFDLVALSEELSDSLSQLFSDTVKRPLQSMGDLQIRTGGKIYVIFGDAIAIFLCFTIFDTIYATV